MWYYFTLFDVLDSLVTRLLQATQALSFIPYVIHIVLKKPFALSTLPKFILVGKVFLSKIEDYLLL